MKEEEEYQKSQLNRMEKEGALDKYRELIRKGDIKESIIYNLINVDIVRRILGIKWKYIIEFYISMWIEGGIKPKESMEIFILYNFFLFYKKTLYALKRILDY